MEKNQVDKNKYLEKLEPFYEAYKLAQICLHIPERVKEYPSGYILGRKRYELFISMAAHLWVLREKGTNYILLPADRLRKEELLNLNITTIYWYRTYGEKEGYLTKIKRHDQRKCQPTKFKFDLSKTPEITKYHMLKNLDLLST